MVTLFWPSQAWFPLLLELMMGYPRLLLASLSLLRGTRDIPHPSFAGWQPAIGGVALLGQSGMLKVLPDETRELLAAAWAPGTSRAYCSAWRVWAGWCVARDVDPSSAPISLILRFLTHHFEESRAYRTINVYRSAIFSAHVGFEGCPVDQHTLFRRLLRGPSSHQTSSSPICEYVGRVFGSSAFFQLVVGGFAFLTAAIVQASHTVLSHFL